MADDITEANYQAPDPSTMSPDGASERAALLETFDDMVSVQRAAIDGQIAALVAQDPPDDPYTEEATTYKESEQFIDVPNQAHVLSFAVASTDKWVRTRNFRVASNITYRVVTWEVTRKTDWPDYPEIDETCGPYVTRKILVRTPPTHGADAVLAYMIRGQYIYVYDQPRQDTDPIDPGKLPHIDYDKADPPFAGDLTSSSQKELAQSECNE